MKNQSKASDNIEFLSGAVLQFEFIYWTVINWTWRIATPRNLRVIFYPFKSNIKLFEFFWIAILFQLYLVHAEWKC